MEKINLVEINKKSTDLRCLASEHRLAIVTYLKIMKSASVGQIADNLRISFKATSKHLAILEKGGVLTRRSDNPFVIYFLSSDSSNLIKSIISLL
jgi:predicted transcriptional regulator